MAFFAGKHTVGTHVYDLGISTFCYFREKMREITVEKGSCAVIVFRKLIEKTYRIDYGVITPGFNCASKQFGVGSITDDCRDEWRF